MLWGDDKNVVIFGNLSAGGGGGDGGPEGGLSHPLLMFTVWLFQLPVTLFLYTCWCHEFSYSVVKFSQVQYTPVELGVYIGIVENL